TEVAGVQMVRLEDREMKVRLQANTSSLASRLHRYANTRTHDSVDEPPKAQGNEQSAQDQHTSAADHFFHPVHDGADQFAFGTAPSLELFSRSNLLCLIVHHQGEKAGNSGQPQGQSSGPQPANLLLPSVPVRAQSGR